MESKKIINAIKTLERKHGKGIIMDLEDGKVSGVKFQSTGVYSLDRILGGGIPAGRIVEMFGVEASGKSTLAVHIAKTFQDAGKKVAYIDVEQALDPVYAKQLGLDIKDLIFSQPDWGEQALEVVDALVEAGVDLIIVDSVANLVPKAELEGKPGDAIVGKMARLMSQAMRRLVGALSESGSSIIFINQIRQKIGGFSFDPNVTPGGLALKFSASIRLKVARKATLKGVGAKNFIGIRLIVKSVKNKVASPFQECEFDMIFGKGVSIESDLLSVGIEDKIIKLDGRTYKIGDEIIGTSQTLALERIKEDEKLKKEIIKKLKK